MGCISLSKAFCSLLGFSDSDDRPPLHRWRHFQPPPDQCGLHILAAGTDSKKLDHMLESPSVGQASVAGADGKNECPSAWDCCGSALIGRGTGIGICTESLGCESCEIGVDDEGEVAGIVKKAACLRSRRRTADVRFPPPLRWMMGGGERRRRFLKAERRDGRFVLTEIRMDHPPETMRAFRNNGRLRLELVESEGDGAEEAIKCAEEETETPAIRLEEESNPVAVGSEYEEEAWLVPNARSDGHRCVEAVCGDPTQPPWCHQRFVTMV